MNCWSSNFIHAMKFIFDWIAAVAWPAAVLTIAIMYRKPISALLQHVGGVAQRAATQPFKAEIGNFKMEFRQAVEAKNPQSVQDAVNAAADVANDFVRPTSVLGRPDLVRTQQGKIVNVSGFAPGTQVKDPYTPKIFRVPTLLSENM